MKRRAALLITLLFALSVAADDADPMTACDNTYAGCYKKCDVLENAPSECYCTCDDTYQQCLDIANGYPPEPSKKQCDVKTAPKVVKSDANKSAVLKSQEQGTDPNSAGHK